MHTYFKKPLLKDPFLFLFAAGLIIAISWRAARLNSPPNLLLNSGFELEELTGWTSFSDDNPQSSVTLAGDNHNTALALSIPDTPGGSWVGIGQRAPAEPAQNYEVSVDYRLIDQNQNTSTIILRISEFDETETLIKSEDIPYPGSLDANPNAPKQPDRRSITHNFTTNNNTALIEIGWGILGQQTTMVELDNLVLTPSNSIQKDPVIRLLCLLLIGLFVYKWFAWKTGKSVNQRLVAIGAANIVLFFIFAELAALGIYFARDGTLFYTHKKPVELIRSGSRGELTTQRIHPYFGFVMKPNSEGEAISPEIGSKRAINNYGLPAEYDYPFVKSNDNQYIIGIFGGSVAEEISRFAGDNLISALKKSDFFADKEIIILNFARSGYKQPQQLIVLNYFLSIGQEFDMVINIDGFNEVVVGSKNYEHHIDIAMPHIDLMNKFVDITDQTTLTSEKLQSLAKIDRYRTDLNNLAGQINKSKIASIHFVLEQYYALTFSKYTAEINNSAAIESSDFSEASLLFVKPNSRTTEESLFEDIAENWAISSIMMSRLLVDQKTLYFHFIQPNQYYSNKVFTADELEVAVNQTHPYKVAAEKGYPALIQKMDFLKDKIGDFYDGIPIFDDVTETIYRDDCCHYNQAGYDMLVEFMANSILESKDFQTGQAASGQ